MKKFYDLVLMEKPLDAGLTRRDLKKLLKAMDEDDEVILVEICSDTTSAMGLLVTDAAEELDYRYGADSELYAEIAQSIDESNGEERELQCCGLEVKFL